MFQDLSLAPPDPILGLAEQIKRDPNPDKIDLTVGVYQDEHGKTPSLACVREAERRLLAEGRPKTYLPIVGGADYGQHVRRLLFGQDSPLASSGRVVTAHTPGGTGGLRVAADFLAQHYPSTRVWISVPTWANHGAVFRAARLEVENYPYYDATSHGLVLGRMLQGLSAARPGDVLLLHGCCHNPTGADPGDEEWQQLAALCKERQLLPLFDFAYQGFGAGLDDDARGLRLFAAQLDEILVCSSFSKNFGLYNERVGALTLVAGDDRAAEHALSHIKVSVRSNYSNPPCHGGAVVSTILGDAALAAQWQQELGVMRGRMQEMRRALVEGLARAGVKQDFGFLLRQRGMFSLSGLSREQVLALRDRHGVYILESGRINVAGITTGNVDRLCSAMADVLR
jgi:aspartate aminotransferase